MKELADLITEYVNTHQAEYLAWLANKRREEDGKKTEKKCTGHCGSGPAAVHPDPDGIECTGLAN